MQQEFKYIYQVYKAGSFSQAAKDLFMTQPALSIAVQKIEAGLGQQLFDRSCHPLALTDAGKIYIATIGKALLLEQEMQQQLADLQELRLGSLRLGGSHFLNAYILPQALALFAERYPQIKLELSEAGSAKIVEQLSQHELDLAFSCDEAVIAAFPHEAAFTDNILLAVNEGCAVNEALTNEALTAQDIQKGRHLEDACPSVNLSYFNNVDFVLLTQENNLYKRSLAMLAAAGVQPAVKMQVTQLVTAYHLVEQLPVASFVSSRVATHTDTRLKFYKLAYPEAVRHFAMLWPRRDYMPLSVRTFMKLFQQIYLP